jgi:hypothetical protein
VNGCLNRSNLIPGPPHLLNQWNRFPGMRPRNRLLGAQGRFGDGAFGRPARYPAKVQFFQAHRIGRTEEGTDIV